MKLLPYLTSLILLIQYTSLIGQRKDSLLQVIKFNHSDSLKASALNSLAWDLRFSNGDSATLLAKEALSIAQKLNDQKLLFRSSNYLATTLAIQGKFDQSLPHFRQAAIIAKHMDNAENQSAVHNNVGLVYYLKGEQDSAIAAYSRALEANQQQDSLTANMANPYNNIGLIYTDKGELDEALKNYQAAVEIFDSLAVHNAALANTYNNIGIIYEEKGDYPKSLEYYLNALKVYEQNKTFADGYANTLSNIGVIYSHMKEYQSALEYYQRSREAHAKIAENSIGESNALNNLGEVYLKQKNYDKALDYFLQALAMQEGNGEASINMANTLSNIGHIKEINKEYSFAMEYHLKSLRIFKKLEDRKGIAKTLTNLGKLKINYENKPTEGVDMCKQSLKIANDLALLQTQMYACECLTQGYEKLGDQTTAYKYFKEYVNYKDSLINRENTKEITQKAMQYEFDKIQYQDSLRRAEEQKRAALLQREKDLKQEAEIQRQRILTIAGGAGFLLMLGLAFVLFRGYKNKQRANEIITAQKNEVESQKKAVEEQKEIIEEKNREIVDSITYAQRIQNAILPTRETIQRSLPQSFVFFKPKDIVSGDFYWIEEKEKHVYFAAVDCTGHGVPGAMVSVVGYNGLNRVLNEFKVPQPAAMLDKLNELVEETFSRSDSSIKDGMDLAICKLNKETNELEYAGANNSLYLVRDSAIVEEQDERRNVSDEKSGKTLIEIKADKQPIGKYDFRQAFTNHQFQLHPGDAVYIFSDGYADQFGGEKGKKFMYKPFKKMLAEIANLKMDKQGEYIRKAFHEWKGRLEQIDDVCVMGVKV